MKASATLKRAFQNLRREEVIGASFVCFAALSIITVQIHYRLKATLFPFDGSLFVRIFGLMGLLSAVPVLLKGLIPRQQKAFFESYGSRFIMVTLGAVALGSLPLPRSLHHAFGIGLGICGVLSALWVAVQLFRMEKLRIAFGTLASGLLFGRLIFILDSNLMINPAGLQAMISSVSSRDVFGHMAITNMIQTYGVPGVGVDGIQRMHYHFGSHWIFAALGNLFALGGIETYFYAFTVVWIPLFFLMAFMAVVDYFRPKQMNLLAFGLLFVTSIVGILSSEFYLKLILVPGWPFFASESYHLALIFMLAFVGWLTRNGGAPARWLLLPLAATLLTLLKISVGFLFLMSALYLFCRLFFRMERGARFAFASSIAAAVLSVIFFGKYFVADPEYRVTYFPLFATLHRYIPMKMWIFFFLQYFWLILIIFGLLIAYPLSALWVRIKNREFLYVEAVGAFAVASLIPLIVMNTDSAVFYFSDPQNWLAVPLAAGLLGIHWREFSAPFKRLFVLVALFLLVTPTMRANVAIPRVRFDEINRHILVVQKILQEKLVVSKEERQNDTFFRSQCSSYGEECCPSNVCIESKFNLTQELTKLARLDVSEKKHTAVYVSPLEKFFWKFHQPDFISLFVPAVTSMAMLDGIPTAPQKQWGYYYWLKVGKEPSRPMNDQQLCSYAKSKNFRSVIRLESQSDTRWESTKLDCST